MGIALGILALVLFEWSLWLVRRARLPRGLTVLSGAFGVVVAALPWLTVLGLVRAFDTVTRESDAAQKQHALASGIALAMWPIAIAICIGAAWLATLTIATVRLRHRWREKPLT